MKLALILYGISLCLIIAFWQFLRKPNDFINDCSDSRLAYTQVPESPWFVWTQSYPEICRTPQNTTARKQYGYFLHITDMHVCIQEEFIYIIYLKRFRWMKSILKEVQ